ncbi:MAG: MmgE/PrpD family protein [Candidatus Lambdaproteobacteria bacterium]|nr:MmgE/PrpD family protein [Candidatus Lambdaproteobacteria bacterium]
MSVTEQLCQTILDATAETLSTAELDAARRVALDALSVTSAGSREKGPRILAKHLQEESGAPASTAIGFGFRTSPFAAAYLNGASMHVLDFEPMSFPSNHSTSPTLPGILALAEKIGAPGREIATALTKGIEMQGRILFASGETVREPFHQPGVVGVMGSAVAAGHLLKLDLDQLRCALGLAASRAGCHPANSGTMTKATHPGLAGALGLDAALLASRGFTASRDIFDGRRDYEQGFFEQPLDESILLGFGKPYRFVDPGFNIKLFPAKFATHWTISAALAVQQAVGDPSRIEAVEIIAADVPIIDRPAPETGLAGKFSLQYTAACALLDGVVKADQFTDERRFQPDMKRLLSATKVVLDKSIPTSRDKMHAIVTATLKDGTRVTRRCDKPAGHFSLPPITRAQHLVKVTDCFRAGGLDEQTIGQCIAAIDRLEHLEPEDVRLLMERLGTPRY